MGDLCGAAAAEAAAMANFVLLSLLSQLPSLLLLTVSLSLLRFISSFWHSNSTASFKAP